MKANTKAAGKVESIEERRQADMIREAELIAEACAKHNPSEAAKAYVRSDFDAHPERERRSADLTAEAMALSVKEVSLGFYTREAVERRAARAKEALGYETASVAEKMLIDHVVACDIRLSVAAMAHSHATAGRYRIDVADHFERRLSMTQRRFERAMIALAKTRALLARAESARSPKLREVGRERAACG